MVDGVEARRRCGQRDRGDEVVQARRAGARGPLVGRGEQRLVRAEVGAAEQVGRRGRVGVDVVLARQVASDRPHVLRIEPSQLGVAVPRQQGAVTTEDDDERCARFTGRAVRRSARVVVR